MKKIAIIGAGITGISAVLYLNHLGIKPKQISVYSKDIGGDYLKGGLKYVSDLPWTRKFLDEIVGMKYMVDRVDGALFTKGIVQPYPEYFWAFPSEGKEVQKQYWKKTRGTAVFDDKCMNDPWQYRNLTKVIPQGGLENMMSQMVSKFKMSCTHREQEIDTEVLAGLIKNYDLIIYTIPVFPLFNLLNIEKEKETEINKLTIYRFRMTNIERIWWEYLYVPNFEYSFHRLDIKKLSETECYLDVEVNNTNLDRYEIGKNLTKLMNSIDVGLCIFNKTNVANEITIKGQIKYDLSNDAIMDKIPENVMLLGRYAEWNKRITWDKVLLKLFNNKDLFKSFVY